METKTEGDSFAATNLEPDPATCIHCGQPRSAHGLRTAACLKAGFYGNHFDPADYVWQWGVRWGETPFSHVYTWCDDEDEARLMFDTSRGERSIVRRMVIQCRAEVVA